MFKLNTSKNILSNDEFKIQVCSPSDYSIDRVRSILIIIKASFHLGLLFFVFRNTKGFETPPRSEIGDKNQV